MKRALSVLLLLAVLVCAFAGCNNSKVASGKELLENTKFEEVTSTTLGSWYKVQEKANTSDCLLTTAAHPDGAAESYGKTYLKLSNTSASGNYSYIEQSFAVEQRSVYKITVVMKASALSKGNDDTFTGAGVRIMENGQLLTHVDAVGDWATYELYVKPQNCNELTLALTLGAPNSYAVGEACFESVSVVKVDKAPEGADVNPIYKPREKLYEKSSIEGILFTVLLSFLTIGIIIGAYFVYRKLLLDGEKKPSLKNVALTTVLLIVVGLAIRFVLASTLFAGAATSKLFSFVKALRQLGFSNVYNVYPEYAPLQIYQLYLVGVITSSWTSLSAVSVMVRLFSILCEGATIAVLYLFARKHTSDKLAALIAGIYAVLPVAFVISAGFDVTVAPLTFLLLVSGVCIVEKKHICLLIASLLGVLWSSLFIYALPFILLYEIMTLIKKNDKKLYITYAVGWFVSLILFVMLSSFAIKTDFYTNGKIFNIFARYITMMFKSQRCVSDAFNLYGLFGLNNIVVNNTAFWLNIVFGVILVTYTVSLYFKNKNRAEIMLLISFFMTVISVFSLNMNSTALSLGLVLLLAYIAVSDELRLYWVFGWLALLAFVNVGLVINMSGYLGDTYVITHFLKGSAVYAFCNVIASLTTLYFGYVVYDITANTKRKLITPIPIKVDKK
jgi:hypothetical protein